MEYDNENQKDMGFITRLVINRKNDKVILLYYNIFFNFYLEKIY